VNTVVLAISVIVSGIALGLLIGLLSFSLVFLNKTTGVANFAIGNIGMFEAFVVYQIYIGGMGIWSAAALGAVFSVIFGALIYLVVLRPFSNAGQANILVRTVGLYLLLAAMANVFFGSQQPYAFPPVLPKGGTTVGGVVLAWPDLITVALIAVIGAIFVWMFRYTELGLQFLAVAQRAPIARLLGIRVQRLSVIAYMMAGVLALIVGLLVAPKQLLYSQMMDPILLYAFAAAVVGGLTSLWGAFVGGIIIGVATNLVSAYLGGDLALASGLAIMLLTLAVRPNGLFGDAKVARL
jgi:branched-chain amino acid transport system permease protein